MSKLNKYLESIRSEALYPAKKEGLDKLEKMAANLHLYNPTYADSGQAREQDYRYQREFFDLAEKLSEKGLKNEVDKIFDKHDIKAKPKNTSTGHKLPSFGPAIKREEALKNITIEQGQKMVDRFIESGLSPQDIAIQLRHKGMSSWVQGKLIKYAVGKINEQI